MLTTHTYSFGSYQTNIRSSDLDIKQIKFSDFQSFQSFHITAACLTPD